MAVTLSDLKGLVYRRLGDRNWQTNPTHAQPDDVRDEINTAILWLVRELEGRETWPLLTKIGFIPVVAGTRDYSLDDDLVDDQDAQLTDFRGYAWIERVESDTHNSPVVWTPQSDHRLATQFQQYDDASYHWRTPDAEYTHGAGDRLCRLDDRTIRFVVTPDRAFKLQVTYQPHPTQLSADGDDMAANGLRVLESWKHLIALHAALALLSDLNSTQWPLVQAQYDKQIVQLDEAVEERMIANPRRASMHHQGRR